MEPTTNNGELIAGTLLSTGSFIALTPKRLLNVDRIVEAVWDEDGDLIVTTSAAVGSGSDTLVFRDSNPEELEIANRLWAILQDRLLA